MKQVNWIYQICESGRFTSWPIKPKNVNVKRTFDEPHKSTEDDLPEKLHIFSKYPLEKTAGRSTSKTFAGFL